MIRAITSEDIEHVLDMIHALHAESPYYSRAVAYERDYIRAQLTDMVPHENFIGVTDDKLRGVMFGAAGPTWFARERNAHELALFVRAEHRGGILAARLIKSFERAAAAKGCVHVHAGTSTLVKTEETLRLYERLGYSRDGSGVIKRIQKIV